MNTYDSEVTFCANFCTLAAPEQQTRNFAYHLLVEHMRLVDMSRKFCVAYMSERQHGRPSLCDDSPSTGTW